MQKALTTLFLLLLGPAMAWAQSEVTVTDESIDAGDQVTWSADTTYILSGIVFVEDGAVLTIEAGTVIKAEDGQNLEASALVITRGAQIIAEGTADEPIIFTSVNDDLEGSLTYQDRGEWGGLVLLGKATTNNQPDGTKEVEGINQIVTEGDERATYGGDDDEDSSGILRYVSIRHTGINIGDESGNEIQGLTLGAVGAGTTIEYVESFASDDDGFEFFGGTVNTKYLVSAFNADDSFDYDEGFRGKGQYWFAIQANDLAGRVAEQDGAGGNEFFEPYAIPVFYNVTYIGADGATASGDGAEMLMFRDNAGGKYYNSIFTTYNSATGDRALSIEDIDNTGEKTEDSFARFEAGDLGLTNNLWWGFGSDDPAAFALVVDSDNEPLAEQPASLVEYLTDAANANTVADPMLAGVSYDPDMGLDPRPNPGSPAWTNDVATPGDEFFDAVNYQGAFGESNWLLSWTALDDLGYIGDLVGTDIEQIDEVPGAFSLRQNYPNPFNPATTIEFGLDQAQRVRLSVYDMLGREIAVLADGVQPAGTYAVQFDAGDLASGMYFYRLAGEKSVVTRSMMLLK